MTKRGMTMTTLTTTNLTPTDKAVYQWECIDGIKKIIDHCFDIASTPVHVSKEDNRVAALYLALESYLQIADMIKGMKIQHYQHHNPMSNNENTKVYLFMRN